MDSIENQLFKNKKFDENKMLSFGFKFNKKNLIFVKSILEGQFELTVTVSNLENIETKLVDTLSGELYTLHLVNSVQGTFVGEVRSAYYDIMNQIAQKCCNNTYFVFEQTNRITDFIKIKFNNTPEFLWDKFPGYGVFRNPENKKWYALISRIDKSKLDKALQGEIEILNIKMDKDKIQELLNLRGFYPAYHMNKKNWITIILDDSFDDKTVMALIEQSHRLSESRK